MGRRIAGTISSASTGSIAAGLSVRYQVRQQGRGASCLVQTTNLASVLGIKSQIPAFERKADVRLPARAAKRAVLQVIGSMSKLAASRRKVDASCRADHGVRAAADPVILVYTQVT